MDEFISQGKLPNFARLRNESLAFVTDAEERAPALEPWIQWVTVHTGMRHADHKITNLGDNANLSYPSIWDIASRHGLRSWVCGSMNASYGPEFQGWVLPDPWSVRIRPNVKDLEPYFEFVQASVQEHTRDKSPLSLGAHLKFLRFIVTHGVKLTTAASIAMQLLRERFSRSRWRRATVLDRLQCDLFKHIFTAQRPDFATFFSNSTAHYQHMYWRNMEPAVFDVKPTPEDQQLHADAVLFGYQQMDKLIGEFRRLAGNEAVLIFGTALSQQPCLKYDASGGRTFYRLADAAKFLAFLGIERDSCSVEPVMSQQFHLRFREAASASNALRLLQSLKVGERPAIKVVSADSLNILAGCAFHQELPPGAVLEGDSGSALLSEHFYHVDLKKSGMHHHHGMLWIRVPGSPGRQVSEIVPLVDVAPSVLSLLGIPVPAQMPGRSLMRYAA
ncbi:MAG: hypothetical protein ABI859_03145 [Pseudomonadota bacterium]